MQCRVQTIDISVPPPSPSDKFRPYGSNSKSVVIINGKVTWEKLRSELCSVPPQLFRDLKTADYRPSKTSPGETGINQSIIFIVYLVSNLQVSERVGRASR